MIDLIYKALAPVLPNDIIAGSSASLSFCSYAGVRPSGDYWVFLEVNEGSYGGRPRADGPDCIDNLMANTRNNPIEDLAMHLPMICDRYELRDDVMPGAGRSRGGIGVVKAQRVLTDAFITHENERHFDVPWGIFGGDAGPGRKSRDLQRRPPKRRQTHAGEVFRTAGGRWRRARFLRPCGGGFGDPLERPAAQVLDDVLDGFCTVDHARAAYGVVVDPAAETVDETATKALRARMSAGAGAASAATAVSAACSRGSSENAPRQAPAPSRLMSRSGLSPLRERPLRPVTGGHAAGAPGAERRDRPLTEVIRGLRAAYGEDWSFEVMEHSASAHAVEVIGQLRANGTSVRRIRDRWPSKRSQPRRAVAAGGG